MLDISDHHRYLFLGKITGTLTGEEQRELEDLFSGDAALTEAYESYRSTFPVGRITASVNHINTSGFWKDVPAEIKNTQRKVIKKKVIASAGIIVLAILITGIWIFRRTSVENKHTIELAVSRKLNTPGVELKLAGGKTINLTNEQGKLQANGVTFSNIDKNLSFHAEHTSEISTSVLTVPAGLDYKLNLPDGSEVWLNSKSKVEFPSRFSDIREISIAGEAYIKVAKDAHIPFIVKLPNSSVKVMGTQFNVNTYNKSHEKIALVEGSVKIKTVIDSVQLTPGNQGVTKNGAIFTQPFDEKKELSWRKGLFYFERTDLDELSQVLERWFNVKTIIDNPTLPNKKFAGLLDKNKSVTIFLDNLKAVSKIDYYFDKAGALHFK